MSKESGPSDDQPSVDGDDSGVVPPSEGSAHSQQSGNRVSESSQRGPVRSAADSTSTAPADGAASQAWSHSKARRPDVQALLDFFPVAADRFAFLYESLSVLDSKASSLMAFNAIGLAALAVWLEYVPQNFLHLALDAIFVLLVLSSAICFWVVRVHWSPPEHFRQPELHTETLVSVRDQRTSQYRWAWWLSLISVLAFGAVSAATPSNSGLQQTPPSLPLGRRC
jgi:hypothetical protein